MQASIASAVECLAELDVIKGRNERQTEPGTGTYFSDGWAKLIFKKLRYFLQLPLDAFCYIYPLGPLTKLSAEFAQVIVQEKIMLMMLQFFC